MTFALRPEDYYHTGIVVPDLDAAMAASGGRPLAIDVERGGTRLRLRATPILAFVQPLYGDVRRRWALGVSHTEYRMVPCREEPDCE